jgi:hypothetical protein
VLDVLYPMQAVAERRRNGMAMHFEVTDIYLLMDTVVMGQCVIERLGDGTRLAIAG